MDEGKVGRGALCICRRCVLNKNHGRRFALGVHRVGFGQLSIPTVLDNCRDTRSVVNVTGWFFTVYIFVASK